MSNKILSGLALLLISVLAVLYLRTKNQVKTLNIHLKSKEAQVENFGYLLSEAYNLRQYSWSLVGTQVGSIKVKNNNKEEFQLKEILTDKCLIYFFEQESCWDCIHRDLKFLNELIRVVDKANIIIIAKDINPGYLYGDKNLTQWQDQAYYTNEDLYGGTQQVLFHSSYSVVESDGTIKFSLYSSKNVDKSNKNLFEHLKTYGL